MVAKEGAGQKWCPQREMHQMGNGWRLVGSVAGPAARHRAADQLPVIRRCPHACQSASHGGPAARGLLAGGCRRPPGWLAGPIAGDPLRSPPAAVAGGSAGNGADGVHCGHLGPGRCAGGCRPDPPDPRAWAAARRKPAAANAVARPGTAPAAKEPGQDSTSRPMSRPAPVSRNFRTWHPSVQEAVGSRVVGCSVAGPGSDFSEGSMPGFESTALELVAAPECPPGLVL